MGNFSNQTSKFKMVIYLKNRERLVYYSLENEEKRGDGIAVRGMVRRLLQERYKGKYQTAIVYNNNTKDQVLKYVRGMRE